MSYQALSDREINLIRRETLERDRVEPRILAASFDPTSGNLVLQFRDGQCVSATARKLRGLENATDAQLKDIYPEENGAAVFWGALDVKYTTIALLEDIFGVKTTQSAGAKGGSAKSAQKAAQSRANGAKGGRPRKVTVAPTSR